MINKKSALLCFTLLSSVAAAQAYETNGWRLQPEFSIGAGYGLTAAKDEKFNSDDSAIKVFGLVKFNEYVGLEASYIDFEKSNDDNATFEVTGKTLAVIFEAPLTEEFSLYVKGGQLWWDADATFSSPLLSVNTTADGNESFWGVGSKFRLTDNLDLRAEYERYNFEISRDEVNVLQTSDINMDVDYVSLNLQLTF